MNEQTMYESMPAVSALNRVEGFEPKSLMREIGEGENKQLYLDVAIRKLWFRLMYPFGKIQKKIVQMTDQFAIVEARVYLDKGDSEDGYVSNAFARRYFNTESDYGPKYLELAETAAVGRALADCAFGSQFADLEGDTDSEQVDAGVPVLTIPAESASAEDNDTPVSSPAIATTNGIAYQAAPAAESKTAATPKQPARPAYTSNMDVNTILATMTLEEAKNLVVGIGMNKGKKLGVIAVESPKDLKWYIEGYRGPDNILRAAATLLINTAMQAKAG
jgi:hypothetical protein